MQLVRCRPKRHSLRLRPKTCMRSEQRFRSERPSCPGTFIRLQNFVQVLLGRLCFRGVSWLLLCTSKEVTRSAAGRAEALAFESHPLAGRERKTAGCAMRKERDHGRATLTRAFGAASSASGSGEMGTTPPAPARAAAAADNAAPHRSCAA